MLSNRVGVQSPTAKVGWCKIGKMGLIWSKNICKQVSRKLEFMPVPLISVTRLDDWHCPKISSLESYLRNIRDLQDQILTCSYAE